jgi:hypothetical protein
MGSRTSVEALSWREELLFTLTHWSVIFGGVIAIAVILRALVYDFVEAPC